MQIDHETAVMVCAGPSLDRLAHAAWAEISLAGAVVAVNGALVAVCCLENRVRFTHAAAMTSGQHMEDFARGFLAAWESTPAWRLTKSADRDLVAAETYVDRHLDWTDDPNGGFFGGSSSMSTANWLHNDWPDDETSRRDLLALSARTGKPIPRRVFRKFVYVGLDMVPGQGGHAAGAGVHASGFTSAPDRDVRHRQNWKRFCDEARRRGSEVLNLSPGTGLMEMPHREPPFHWLR
jgi:hypothetical protein